MPEKLKSALMGLGGSTLPLALKSVGLGILVFFALVTGNWLFIAAFVLAGCYFYFVPGVNFSQFLTSFAALLLLPALFYRILDPNYFLLVALSFAAAFFTLFGVKNLVFIRRQSAYCFLNSFLVLAVLSLFFWSDKTNIFFFVKYLLAFSVFFFLFKEFVDFSASDLGERKKKIFIWSISFLIFQIVWALSFLPINFLNASAFILLIVLMVEDFVSRHLAGAITRKMVLRNITIFLVMALAIFGSSSWSL